MSEVIRTILHAITCNTSQAVQHQQNAALNLDLEPHPDGVILPVRAHAGARRNTLKGIHAGALQVMVTQAPEKGKANKAILELLAEKLDLRKSQLELLAGETSPQKRVLVRDITNSELAARISTSLEHHR